MNRQILVGEIIPTYIINLKERTDRLKHIDQQFKDKPEFSINIIEAVKHRVGAIGLWQSVKKIVSVAREQSQDLILICEDDHQFTEHYSKEHLFNCITEAQANEADILSGGVSWLQGTVAISKSLFWLDKFNGLQFTIIFKKFFESILEASLEPGDVADYKISSLTEKKFFMYPFISVQKEFGYSDATYKNNGEGHVTELFNNTSETIQKLLDVAVMYKTSLVNISEEMYDNNIIIPTYIINLPERQDRLKHIKKQFEGRSEFDITVVKAFKHEIGAVGLWQSMRKVIQMAINNDDDVIVICEDDHEFTEKYSKGLLLKNIIEAHHQAIDILSGGIGGGFNHVIPVTNERFWINHFYCTQFIIVYKKFFQKILDEPFDDKVTADDFLSALTSNKMVFYPFISVQKDFGYSDVTRMNNNVTGAITRFFKNGDDRLYIYKKIYDKYLRRSS